MTKFIIGIVVSLVLIGCNPLGPSELDVVSGITMTPAAATVPINGEQYFSIQSLEGRLDMVRISLLKIPLYNDECACDRYISLGNLKRLEDNLYLYTAPTAVREDIRLPITLEISAAFGDVGHGAEYQTLGHVKVTR